MKPKFSFFPHGKKRTASRGQAIVEFAIVLPVLLMMLFGIIEAGRLLLTYAMVVNASRDAVRYGSAVGLDRTGNYARYKYCDGIREMAKASGFLLGLQNSNITIQYDHGPGTSAFATCSASGGEDTSVNLNSCKSGSCDRVSVKIEMTWTPIVKLLPLKQRTISSTSYRSVIGIADVGK